MAPKKRPEYIPERLDWFPGEPLAKRQITVREPWTGDYAQVKALLKAETGYSPSPRTYARWLTRTDCTVYLCVRNKLHVVGLVVARTRPHEVRILHLAVDKLYHRWSLDDALLLVSGLELPEAPMRWTVPSENTDLQVRLREIGWSCVAITDRRDTAREFEYRFSGGPIRRKDC